MDEVNSAFEIGDRIPNFALPDPNGLQRIFVFETDGRPGLLIAAREGAKGRQILATAADLSTEIAGLDCQVMGVLAPGLDVGFEPAIHFVDADQQVLKHLLAPASASEAAGSWGAPADALVFSLDANQRVIGLHENIPAALDRLRAHDGGWVEQRRVIAQGAPVLMMERLLPPDLCREMIEAWKNDHAEGAVSNGLANAPDPSVKKNREHVVRDQTMIRRLAGVLGKRIAPELEKVFNHRQPSRFEAFMVLSYTAERRDFFGPHRDNLRAQQKRRFAMSLNLNDDFDGGELVFPEYGPHRYLPPVGGAAIFSCSLLHEALPVTRGQRWTMTTFFCDP